MGSYCNGAYLAAFTLTSLRPRSILAELDPTLLNLDDRPKILFCERLGVVKFNYVDPAYQQRPTLRLSALEAYTPEPSKGIFVAWRSTLYDCLEIPIPCNNNG